MDVALLSIFFALFGTPCRPASHAAACKVIADHGGEVWSVNRDGREEFFVNFVSRRVPEAAARKFKDVSNLTALDLGYARVDDAVLKHINGLPCLRSLSLTGAQGMSDEGMAQIKFLPKLQSLTFGRTAVGDHGLAFLKTCPDLKRLQICSDYVTDQTLSYLAGARDLEELHFEPCKGITDKGFRHLRGLTKLRELRMDGAALTDGGLECLKDCTNLTILSLMNCRIAGTGFREFRRPNAMRQLHLSCNKLSATGVDALVKAFPGVESLSIDGAHMTDDDMAPIWKLKDVKFFGASDNPVTDRTLERMADWASVCEIGLIRTKVTGSGLSKLKKCANLRGLWLSGSPVTDKGIASLPPLQGLSSLCLSKTLVSDDALAAVAKLPNLRNVYLKNSKIVGHGMAAFKGHPKLELIDLNDSNFSGDHLHLLLDIPALRVIAIGGSRCNREQVENFGKLRPVMKIYCSNL